MSIHKSTIIKKQLIELAQQNTSDNPWVCSFPNVADFNFNYYTLLNNAKDTGIAMNTNPGYRVAVIGLGVAGLTAARELFRSGYTKLDMYEATDRISGRTYSIPAKDQYTTFELGAMRMPFFTEVGDGQCILDYLTQEFGLTVQDFPDPGSSVANTGIYMNNGLGPDDNQPFSEPELMIWETKGQDPVPPPPNELLQDVYAKWEKFADMFTQQAAQVYGTDRWDDFWKQFVTYYWNLNFRELVVLDAIDQYDPNKPAYFGGLGMSESEARLFYTIGAGDGSWGAFYQIGALYPVRTLLFGFASNHKLIQGRFDSKGEHNPGPYSGQSVYDSFGRAFESPKYLGVQSYGECLMFNAVSSHDKEINGYSLYDSVKSDKFDTNLYMYTSVNRLSKNSDGTITLGTEQFSKTYDAVILTVPTWAMQLSISFENFDYAMLPPEVQYGLKSSHWITSCKVFCSLKERYWETTNIPQLISTDTYLQGVYGYGVDIKDEEGNIVKQDPGVLLLSYTWEDDANKFLPDLDDDQLVDKCIAKLDSILENCTNIGQGISQYVNRDEPAVIHWSQQPTYRGCAKLYRQSTWSENFALLSYNQDYSHASNLYFAGEAFSLEGGWTEPALRYSIDAVLNLVKNSGGKFLNGFDMETMYPTHENWIPG